MQRVPGAPPELSGFGACRCDPVAWGPGITTSSKKLLLRWRPSLLGWSPSLLVTRHYWGAFQRAFMALEEWLLPVVTPVV